MRLLYAGDGEVGGAANYVLGVCRALRIAVTHVPPSRVLTPGLLTRRPHVVILSDMAASRVPRAAQEAIAAHVARGGGLLMVGGWGSFSGPFGGWRGTRVESLLPVRCRAGDDRVHAPGGALLVPVRPHPILDGVSFRELPVICGWNAIQPTRESLIVLRAHRLLAKTTGRGQRPQLSLERMGSPLLVVAADPARRVAALATDLAPHWCGGLVDWGRRRRGLPVRGRIRIEVGDRYVQFIGALLHWLAGARS